MSVDKPIDKGTMEIYDAFKWPDSVQERDWDKLTKEEKDKVLDAYRFSGFRPGTYQGVTFAGPNFA